MKKKLEAMLQKKQGRKDELMERAKTSEDVVELRGINTEIETLNGEIEEVRGMIESLPQEPGAGDGQEPENRSFKPLAT